jgi:3-methyl-2-oxobutanoate hydroxymethyltransferase
MKTPFDLLQMKQANEKISMLTAYDVCFSRLAEAAGIDLILVGDSLANVVLGLKSTRDVGMSEMKLFTSAVCRGALTTHVVADMPWGSDHSLDQALLNTADLINCGATSVKIEGNKSAIIRSVVKDQCPVMGHIGLTPQTAKSRRQTGQTKEEANTILNEALELEQAGVFCIVLEHIPTELGKLISNRLSIPTIGIGAGPHCNGQVLVLHDVLGLDPSRSPPFAKQFESLEQKTIEALSSYNNWVKSTGID